MGTIFYNVCHNYMVYLAKPFELKGEEHGGVGEDRRKCVTRLAFHVTHQCSFFLVFCDSFCGVLSPVLFYFNMNYYVYMPI